MSTRSVYRWRIVSGFCTVFAFTVLVALYLPLYRAQDRLRADRDEVIASRAAGSVMIEQLSNELETNRAENDRLKQQLDSPKSASSKVRSRIERLERNLSAQFGRLAQAKMLVVSSAGDRVSVAMAVSGLFSARETVTESGRTLLCELAKTIMAEFKGQIRVTGYYGSSKIDDPVLAARHASPWHLAAARASSAAAVLQRDCAVPTERFQVVSYGPRAAGPLGENVAFEFVFTPED